MIEHKHSPEMVKAIEETFDELMSLSEDEFLNKIENCECTIFRDLYEEFGVVPVIKKD